MSGARRPTLCIKSPTSRSARFPASGKNGGVRTEKRSSSPQNESGEKVIQQEDRFRRGMKSIILSSVVFLIFFIWPLIPRADAEVTGIEILDAGIIRAEVLGRLSNDQSSTGLMGLNRNTLKFVKSTDRIPAKLQTNFSVKYRVNGSVGE